MTGRRWWAETVLGLCVALSGLLAACGARTELTTDIEDTDTETAEAAEAAEGRDGVEGDNGSSRRPRDNLFESMPLEDCELGQAPPQTDCSYMVDGLCYADQPAACACACPRSRNTTCFATIRANTWGAREVTCN